MKRPQVSTLVLGVIQLWFFHWHSHVLFLFVESQGWLSNEPNHSHLHLFSSNKNFSQMTRNDSGWSFPSYDIKTSSETSKRRDSAFKTSGVLGNWFDFDWFISVNLCSVPYLPTTQERKIVKRRQKMVLGWFETGKFIFEHSWIVGTGIDR